MSDNLPAVPEPGAPTEPVLAAGTVTAAVTAILAGLIAFGLKISDDQQAAILGVIATLAPIVAALWARRNAFSPRTVRRMVQSAQAGNGVSGY